jgi:hypothetical protein
MGIITFMDDDDSHSVTLSAPTNVSSDIIFTLPNTTGTNGQVLQTDGNSNPTLSWAENSGGGGGSTNTVWISFGKNGTVSGSDTIETHTLNGSQNGRGYCLPSAATAKKISMQFDCSSNDNKVFTATIYKNGTTTNQSVDVNCNSSGDADKGGVSSTFTESFTAGQTIRVDLTVPSGVSGDDFAVLVELELD